MTKFAWYSLALGWLVLPAQSAFAQVPMKQPAALAPFAPDRQSAIVSSCDSPRKVCVEELRPTTRVVYSSVAKDICLPHGSLCTWFRDLCGMGCDDAPCGKVHTRNVLVKKVVPGPPKTVCVPRDVVPCQPLSLTAPLQVVPKPILR